MGAFGKLIGIEAQLEIAQALDGHFGAFEAVEGEVQRLTIGHAGEQVANYFGLITAADQIAQGEKIAERFGHLLAFHHEERRMHPEAGEGLAGERFGLRDFVFVMREDQVDAAGVDIERGAQVLNGHHGAFDVPAGAARTDRRIPTEFAFLGRLPQGEIARVGLIVFVDVDAGAGQVAAEIVVRKLAIAGEARDAEVSRAVARVSVVAGGKAGDSVGHIGDVVGGLHQVLGHVQAQGGAVFEKRLRVDGGVFLKRLLFGRRVADDLIVHVGDVHDVVELVTARTQPPAQNVDEGEGAEVADVGVTVNGGAARVQANRVAVRGMEVLDALGECVIEAQRHNGGETSS